MGSQKRPGLSTANNVPGPGSYQYGTTVGEGPKIALSAKPQEMKTISVAPGPGAYEPKHDIVHEKTPSTGLGYGSRGLPQNHHAKFVPGPGAYTSKEAIKDGPKYRFGTSQRTEYKGNKMPGPGNYSLPSTIAVLPSYEKVKGK